jgi:hypothetical protein
MRNSQEALDQLGGKLPPAVAADSVEVNRPQQVEQIAPPRIRHFTGPNRPAVTWPTAPRRTRKERR